MIGAGTITRAVVALLCIGYVHGTELREPGTGQRRHSATRHASAGSESSPAMSVARRNVPDGFEHRLSITVRDTSGASLAHASVLVLSEGRADTVQAVYDPDRRIYYTDPDGYFVTIRVSHPGYEPQQRRMEVRSAYTTAAFILGAPGTTYAYIASVMLPYKPRPDIIGFYLARQSPDSAVGDREMKSRLAAAISIERDSIEFFSSGSGGGLISGVLHLNIRGSAQSVAQMRSNLLRELRRNPMIGSAGPVFKLERHSIRPGMIMMDFFTNRLYVHYMPRTGEAEVRALLEGMGLRVVGFVGGLGAFEVAADTSIGEDINDIARQLRALNNVYRADVVPCEIIPKDW